MFSECGGFLEFSQQIAAVVESINVLTTKKTKWIREIGKTMEPRPGFDDT